MTENRSQGAAQLSDAQRKALRFQMIYLLISFGMLILISNETVRTTIGTSANVLLGPVIGFNFLYPILTTVLAGIIIGLITSIPRYFFTDWIRMGRMQLHTRAFSKAIREAYRNNERTKIQKLRKKQMEVSMETQQISMNTMKPLMVMTIFTFLIFMWLYIFVQDLQYELVSFPWASGPNAVNIATARISLLPGWVFIEMLASLTVSYFVTMVLKWFDFTRRLNKFQEKFESQ